MIPESVRSHIDNAAPSEAVTLVLNWPNLSPTDEIRSIGDRMARLRAIGDYYDRAKAPTLEALERRADVEVDRLEGSGQALLRAPASTLRSLITGPQSPLRAPDLEVDLDIADFARTPG